MRKLILFLGVLLCTSIRLAAQQSVKPNIIYILADDLGYGDLSCYQYAGAGQQIVKTPNLDRMAKGGTRFTRFYAGSTVCAPSRCALMTGKHTGHAYVRGNGEIPLRAADTTLAQRLRSNGYRTGMFGKWGLGLADNSGAPQKKGWDEFTGYLHHRHAHSYHTDSLWQVRGGQLSSLRLSRDQYTHDVIMDGAFDFLRHRRADREPFFLYLPVTLVHVELATTDADQKPFLTADGKSRFSEKAFIKSSGGSYSSQENPHATFAAMLTRLDKDVGKILDLLREYGMDQNTYVFFASDNGPSKEGGADPEFFDSNGPLRGIKRDMYEGGIRVPMIAWAPGRVPAGKVSDAIWATWDISPTVCGLTGTTPPSGIDGIDMGRLLGRSSGTAVPQDRYLFWQFDEGELRQAVLQGNWKLVRLKKKGQPERLELYDLDKDIGETTNLASANPDRMGERRTVSNSLYKNVYQIQQASQAYTAVAMLYDINLLMTRLIFWLSLTFLTTTVGAQSVRQPNILWITCEDMSANLPSYGDQTVPTPTIDRLVREGVRYTHMYSTAGVCAPSRSAIISGMYQTSIGTQHMRTNTVSLKKADIPNYEAVPPPNVKCFTEYLRTAGYYCTNNSKTDYQFGNPVTAWDENGPKAHWRNRSDKARPFFSVFNLMVTHESQVWARADKPLRVNPATVKLPPYYPDTPLIWRDLARYYDNIMVMDSLAGSILSQLEADGLLDNTIVVFYSDHGAGLPWYKRELYERGTHVPFVVRFPGKLRANTTDSELHSFVDLAPTMLSLAGIAIPKHLQGQAFLGEQKAKPRQAIFGARDRMDEHYDMVRTMRDERYRYVRNFMPDKPYYQDITYRKQMPLMQEILRLRDAGQLAGVPARWFQTKPVEELYDLKTDPYELINLAGLPDQQPRLQQMRHTLADWMTEISDKGALPEREMVALMYGGSEQPTTAVPTVLPDRAQPTNAVVLTCPTGGASIAYQFDNEDRWQLYHQPVRIPAGRTLRAKAIRYGYMESPVTSWPKN